VVEVTAGCEATLWCFDATSVAAGGYDRAILPCKRSSMITDETEHEREKVMNL
jgi:hypothetical protein